MQDMAEILEPLGDRAVTATFENENDALRFAESARKLEAPWLVDVVCAYTSVAVFFNLDHIDNRAVVDCLQRMLRQPASASLRPTGRLHVIPCCYELQLDLERIARHCRLPEEEVIRLHSEREFTVYAIGFCPGFPYLGYLPEPLCGVPRLDSPRLRVPEGSVGLTGRQSGIYTLPRPGGWNLLGRTPLKLVDVEDEYFPLRTGDRVRFRRIDENEFGNLRGTRL